MALPDSTSESGASSDTSARIIVVSRRKDGVRAPDGAIVVYVGRAIARLGITGSPLGNPFRVPRDYDTTRDPDRVMARYREWLDAQLADRRSPASMELERLAAIVREGATLALQCWCAPSSCHAEIIRDALIARLAPA